MKNHELNLSFFFCCFCFLTYLWVWGGGEGGFKEVTLFERKGLKGIQASLTRVKGYNTRQSKEEIISILQYHD